VFLSHTYVTALIGPPADSTNMAAIMDEKSVKQS
jgi:hypothetical protein